MTELPPSYDFTHHIEPTFRAKIIRLSRIFHESHFKLLPLLSRELGQYNIKGLLSISTPTLISHSQCYASNQPL